MQPAIDVPHSSSLFAPPWRNLCLGSIALCSMLAFESMGVAAGMPAVAAALGGLPWYPLAFAATSAGSVVAMVWSGADCDRHGPRRAMVGGLVLFGLGLLLAGLAGAMAMLVLGRLLLGFGVGALGVALYVACARTLPAPLHPRLFALFSTAWVLPSILGPALAGLIVEQLGWRWLFLGLLGLLLPAAALVLLAVRHSAAGDGDVRAPRRTLRWAWLAAGCCLLLPAMEFTGRLAPWCVLALLCALAGASLRLLPAGTLRLAPGLPSVIALRGLIASAFFLCEAFVPLWLYQQRGWSLLAAGLALTGGALSWSVGSHLQSRVSDERRRRALLARGSLLLCAGIVASAAVVLDLLPEALLLPAWALAGLGTGIALPMLGVLTLKLAPRAQQGAWSAALQLCGALGTTAALAAGGVLFASAGGATAWGSYASVFALATLLVLAAWISVPRVFGAPTARPMPAGDAPADAAA